MIKWNEVTWYSRWGAIILFLFIIPTLCFYIGTQYMAVLEEQSQLPIMVPVAVPTKTATANPHYYSDKAIEDSYTNCQNDAHTTLDYSNCIAASADAYTAILNTQFAIVQKSLDQDIAEENEMTSYFRDEKTQLQTAQKSWESYIKDTCTAAEDEWTDGSGRAGGYEECRLDLTKNRIYDFCETGGGPKESRCSLAM